MITEKQLNDMEGEYLKNRTNDLNIAVQNQIAKDEQIILRKGANVPQGERDVQGEDSFNLLLEERELTREEQERIVEESAGQPSFPGGQKVEAAGSEFQQSIQDPELKRKIFKPGENAPDNRPFEINDPRTREQRFGEIRQDGKPPVDLKSVIQPGGFLQGPGISGEESLADFLGQVTGGAASDVIVNTLALAEEGGQSIRDLEIPGANSPSGEAFTVDDALKVFGLNKKIPINIQKLEAKGGPGTAVARGITSFLIGMAVLKGATGAGTLVRGAGADLLAVDRNENISSLLNDYLELDPGLRKAALDFLDNTKTESQTRKAVNNVLEGLGLAGVTTSVIKSLRLAKDAGIKPIMNEKGAIEFPGKGSKRSTFKSPVDSDPEEISQFVNITGRSIDIEDRYSINWRTSALPKEAKLVRAAQRAESAKEIEAGIPARLKMTNEEIAKEASERLSKDPQGEYDKFIKRDVTTDFVDPVDTAIARKIADESALHLYDLARTVETRVVPGAEEEFLEHLGRSSLIEEKAQLYSIAAGRSLQAFNIELKDIQSITKEFREQISKFKASDKVRPSQDAFIVAKRLLNSIESPEQLKNVQTQMARAGKMEMVVEYWINGILSGISTQVANVLSNTAVSIWVIPERAIGAQVSRAAKLFGRTDSVGGVHPGEASAMAWGWKQGIKASYKLMFKNIGRTFLGRDVEVSEFQKLENFRRKAITPENLGLSDTHPFGRGVGLAGEYVRSPGKLLMTMDDFFKGIGYHMEAHRRGFIAAQDAGYGGKSGNFKIDGKTQDQFILDFVANPPSDVDVAAQNFGRLLTFTNELGTAGEKLKSLRDSSPWFSFVLPFIQTPVNIFKFQGQRIAGLNVLSSKVRADFLAGGARRDMAIASTSLGTMTLLAGAMLGAEGKVTGAGVSNPQMKKLIRTLNPGYLDNSYVQLNEDGTPKKYLSLDRLDPVMGFITIGASIGELIQHLDEDEKAELISGATLILREAMLNKTFMRGLAEVFSAIEDNKPLEFGRNLAGSFVPAIAAQFEKTINKEVTDIRTPNPETGKDFPKLQKTMQELERWVDRFRSRVPYYSEGDDNFPLRNFWGEPVVYGPAWPVDFISPIYTAEAKNDPVDNEILRLQVGITRLKPKVRGVELTRGQFDRYQILFGDKTKGAKSEDGLTLYQTIRRLINSKDYKNQLSDGDFENPGSKEKAILALTQDFKKLAAEQLMDEFPGVRKAVALQAIESELAELPEGKDKDEAEAEALQQLEEFNARQSQEEAVDQPETPKLVSQEKKSTPTPPFGGGSTKLPTTFKTKRKR
jgi:hypothetical protein